MGEENIKENMEEKQEGVQENNVNEQTGKNTFDKDAFKEELFKEWREQLEESRQETEKTKNMKPDEKAKYELDKIKKANEDKEAELIKRELRLDAHNVLIERKLDCRILDILDYSNKENCIKSIDTVESIKRCFRGRYK